MDSVNVAEFKEQIVSKYKKIRPLNFMIKALYFYVNTKDKNERVDVLLTMFFILFVGEQDSSNFVLYKEKLKWKKDETIVLLMHIYEMEFFASNTKFMSLLLNLVYSKGYDVYECIKHKLSSKEQPISYEAYKIQNRE